MRCPDILTRMMEAEKEAGDYHVAFSLVAVLSCPARDKTHNPCVGRWILGHWPSREVPTITHHFFFSPLVNVTNTIVTFPVSTLISIAYYVH